MSEHPRSVEGIVRNIQMRRKGILKALTTGAHRWCPAPRSRGDVESSHVEGEDLALTRIPRGAGPAPAASRYRRVLPGVRPQAGEPLP